jgi:hypothetical protein
MEIGPRHSARATHEANAMTVWIFLTLLLPNAPTATVSDGVNESIEPLRYRGIERLLAKFEAEDDDPSASARAGR